MVIKSFFNNSKNQFLSLFLYLFLLFIKNVESNIVEYSLIIDEMLVRVAGKDVKGLTINSTIPGPVLRFTEGDSAIIHVINKLNTTTSIHWHGLLVPPGMDGVPNLSFPPIRPGTTFTYSFPIIQAGTYWYHSHTDLQEQLGVYGGIVIEPANKQVNADREYLVLFSDWTNEKPSSLLRWLKRGNDWYTLSKGTAQSIIGALRAGRGLDYFKRDLQRMPPMDIADVAYNAFLANGKNQISFEALPGEKIRLRIINGSSTTYFHLEFAGSAMEVIAADGLDINTFTKNRMLIAVAEVYDVLITIPDTGLYEFRATSHDRSGWASVWVGDSTKQKRFYAPIVPAPDVYRSMEEITWSKVFSLTPSRSMGMSDKAVYNGDFDKPGMVHMGDMHSDMDHDQRQSTNDTLSDQNHNNTDTTMTTSDTLNQGQTLDSMNTRPHHSSDRPDTCVHQSHNKNGDISNHADEEEHHGSTDDELSKDTLNGHSQMSSQPDSTQSVTTSSLVHQSPKNNNKSYAFNFMPLASDASSADSLSIDGSKTRPWPPYDQIKALFPTSFPADKPVRHIRLTLDGDMNRYVWFINNRYLSPHDLIHIKGGEIVRFIMINRTMMHHPMHLHGHFFRVVNQFGDYSPLKHTVNVAPMSTTVIEFYANEPGDWFFHCHLLYHMESGMERVVHYEEFELPENLIEFRPNLMTENWYFLGNGQLLSNMSQGVMTVSNTHNIFKTQWEVGRQSDNDFEWDVTFSYTRYMKSFLMYYAGVNGQGLERDFTYLRAVGGLEYLLPLNVQFSFRVDHKLDMKMSLDREFTLIPRLEVSGELQYDTRDSEWETSAGISYLLLRYVTIDAIWHNDYGFGAGVSVLF